MGMAMHAIKPQRYEPERKTVFTGRKKPDLIGLVIAISKGLRSHEGTVIMTIVSGTWMSDSEAQRSHKIHLYMYVCSTIVKS